MNNTAPGQAAPEPDAEPRIAAGPAAGRMRAPRASSQEEFSQSRAPSQIDFQAAPEVVAGYLRRIAQLQERYRAGGIRVHLPPGFDEPGRLLDELAETCFPESHAALSAAAESLFFSLPVAFDPAWSVGPYLATVDRGQNGEPYRFLDLGALIATHPFGENDLAVADAVVRNLPYAVARYAHSEYQTVMSLRLKAALGRVAPFGTPRHFVVNTGAEAVENAIKAVLLNRVKSAGVPAPETSRGESAAETSSEPEGGLFVISFEGAFHGRTLGSLAVTHRRKARLGFPTFNWPRASFPVEDSSLAHSERREHKSLKSVWDLLVTGRHAGVPKSQELFLRELGECDAFLRSLPPEREAWPELTAHFVEAARARLDPLALPRARRVAGVLVEPIQGEGGLRLASAWFFQRLRLLTRIYDVPLMFDEVQTGGGATGKLWAHELFDLPSPPDVVVWAKKAQNGVLFVSEELASFFQEEKKFNTTWEGDSVGMVRLLAFLDKLDLGQVRRTGAAARAALEAFAQAHRGFVQNVRGAGVLLGFDVARADWRDPLRERAFRLGLILLPAGERTLRFYPRFDMEPYAIQEAIDILHRAVADIVAEPPAIHGTRGPELRVGSLELPRASLETVILDPKTFTSLLPDMMAVERECYGGLAHYPPNVLRAGSRPLLQYPVEALEATMANPRSSGVALRNRLSGAIVAYALGSPLEYYEEEGVMDDPHYGEGNTFYLPAMAVSPLVRNQAEVEIMVLDALRAGAQERGYEWFSTLIEQRVVENGPLWLRHGVVLRVIDNYLRSGIRFVYVQAPCGASAAAS